MKRENNLIHENSDSTKTQMPNCPDYPQAFLSANFLKLTNL